MRHEHNRWNVALYRVLRAILHWRRDAYCFGVDQGQCLHLREVYGHLVDYSETGKLPLFKNFRSADRVDPDGKRWEGADAGKAKRIKP
jgi:hypothetical protein